MDLWKVPRVGVGSVCRRQATIHTMLLLSHLLDIGLTIHAFGVKTRGIASLVEARAQVGRLETLDRLSADSMAWSMGYRFGDEEEKHLKNKLEGALLWRSKFLAPYEARGLVTAPSYGPAPAGGGGLLALGAQLRAHQRQNHHHQAPTLGA